MESYYELTKSVRITNDRPIDGDRYVVRNLSVRDDLLVESRAFNGLQVYVEDTLNNGTLPWIPKLFLLKDKVGPVWEEITIGNGSGLEAITIDGKTGLRIKGEDYTVYGDIGDHSIDLSYYDDILATNLGATGDGSIAVGINVKASGEQSSVFGKNNIASGDQSTAIGVNTIAKNTASSSLGACNVGESNDTVIEVGVGSDPITDRKNALEIYADGIVSAPGQSIELIDSFAVNHISDNNRDPDINNRILVTVEYLRNVLPSIAPIEKTYAELKSMRDSDGLLPGQRYKITDYKTVYKQPISDVVSNSAQGIADGLDTAVEPLIIKAETINIFNKNVLSTIFQDDTIYYDIDLDLTDGNATHFGGIYYRKNIHVETSWDFRNIKNRRYALKADEWDISTTYNSRDVVKVGNRYYASFDDSNIGNDPATTDGSMWMTIFSDITSRPYLKYIHSLKDYSGTDGEEKKRRWYMHVDDNDYIDLYSFTFTNNLNISSGYIDPVNLYYKNVTIINNLPDIDYKYVMDSNFVYIIEEFNTDGMKIIGSDISNITIRGYWYGGGGALYTDTQLFKDSFLYGLVYGFKCIGKVGINNSFIRGISFFTVDGDGFNNVLATLNVPDTEDTYRLFNSSSGFATNSIVYVKNWMHGFDYLLLYNTKIKDVNVLRGRLEATSCVISGDREFGDNVLNDVKISGTFDNCKLNITSSVIDGDLTNVTILDAVDITIPSTVTLTNVVFDVLGWQGKNNWGTDVFVLKNKFVNKKWQDDDDLPTVEKLWYEEISEEGISSWVELRSNLSIEVFTTSNGTNLTLTFNTYTGEYCLQGVLKKVDFNYGFDVINIEEPASDVIFNSDSGNSLCMLTNSGGLVLYCDGDTVNADESEIYNVCKTA